VKLLLDQNLSRRLVPMLIDAFPGTSQVQLLGLETGTDAAIWSYAGAHGYAVVTKDSDFVELAALRGPPPKVIWLNLGNVANSDVSAKLLENIEAIRDFAVSTEDGVLEIE
jgi:predicted nuclease of predicted toxin-antitoxin system